MAIVAPEAEMERRVVAGALWAQRARAEGRPVTGPARAREARRRQGKRREGSSGGGAGAETTVVRRGAARAGSAVRGAEREVARRVAAETEAVRVGRGSSGRRYGGSEQVIRPRVVSPSAGGGCAQEGTRITQSIREKNRDGTSNRAGAMRQLGPSTV